MLEHVPASQSSLPTTTPNKIPPWRSYPSLQEQIPFPHIFCRQVFFFHSVPERAACPLPPTGGPSEKGRNPWNLWDSTSFCGGGGVLALNGILGVFGHCKGSPPPPPQRKGKAILIYLAFSCPGVLVLDLSSLPDSSLWNGEQSL